MTRNSAFALTVFFVLASSSPAAEVVELFDGKTLDGWTRYGGKHEYSVRDGLIVGKVVEGEASSYLCTDRQFGDFELLFEVKYLVGGDLKAGTGPYEIAWKNIRIIELKHER